MPGKAKDTNVIQTVDNALNVLEALCEEGDEVRATVLSDRLGMNKVSLFRYLATLENRGYVEKTEDSRRYRLGLAAYEVGQKLLCRMGLLRKAKPVMEKLARDCDEALYLVIPRDQEILMFDMIDTTQKVRIVPLVGQRFPLAATAAGKVMLAHRKQNRGDSKQQFAGLDAQLSEIPKRGGWHDRGSFGEGIASLAVPLLDALGNVLGSLCMIGPEFRMTCKRIEEVLFPRLVEAGQVVSSRLGYVDPYIRKARRYR